MKWHISLVSLCLSLIALGQQRQVSATKCEEIILIDGKLDEAVWKSSSVADSFIQRRPIPGEQSSQFTQAMVAYDDFNLYVAARCFDDPEKISRVLSQRDDLNANIDNFQIILDTYNDNLNAFIFGVSSAGVQYDAKVYADNENVELNMAWESHVHFTEKGWQLEMKIPYSAFRFPKKDEQSWGVNFYRYISRNREESYWNAVKPDFDNAVAQCGNLLNINGIEPPLRLAFMPYISGYADRGADPSDPTSWTRSVNGGMDIKLGLNEAFTLDMTLVPDFGQVVYDNKVLNISPFELQFNENRQFFTEGTELFNKSGLFYSRRIGVQQSNSVLFSNLETNEQLLSVDDSPQLYNATKVSGRTKNGLGIGVFNGITAPQQGTAFNDSTGLARSLIVAPLTNYNVLVLDQNLKNNSSVTLTNTNVLRDGSFYDANVSGLDFKINTKDNSYFISGKGTLSSKMYSSSSVLGYNAGMSLGKQTGNVIYKLNYFEESNTYDPNDLGFNTNNNKRNTEASIGYRQFKPFWKFIQASGNATLSYQRLYSPDVYTFTNLNGNIFGLIKGFHATGIRFDASLTKGYDYFEPRTVGRYFLTPTWFSTSYWFSSNYQKKFALDFGLTYGDVGMQDWREYTYNISPRFRFSDRLFLVYSWEQELSLSSRGYAVAFGTPVEVHSGILFGKRNRNSVTNTINITYTLTNRMGITWRIRHYRSSLRYMDFFDLSADGTLNDINYSGNDSDGNSVYNINYNAFTVDFVYRWVFRPGSELNIVWKNAIFNSDQNFNLTYSENLEALFEKAALNSFSMKLIYWIDYQDFRNRTRSQS